MEDKKINPAEILTEDQLENVAGGLDSSTGVPCPKCGNEMRKIYSISLTPSTPAVVGRQCPVCCHYELF